MGVCGIYGRGSTSPCPGSRTSWGITRWMRWCTITGYHMVGGRMRQWSRSCCRSTVMKLVAHTIPLGGHLGKKKSGERIMRRFYWPTLFRDIADFCQSCEKCQKAGHRRVARAPPILLPVINEPFHRIATDIVVHFPKAEQATDTQWWYATMLCGTRRQCP